MKTRGKSRLLCFRPFAVDEADGDMIKSAGKRTSLAGDPVFTYISVSTADLGISGEESEEGAIADGRRRKIARRILARFVRLKVPETQSAKVRNGKFRSDPIHSSNSSEKNAAVVKSVAETCRKSSEVDDRKIKAPTASSSSSSSSSVSSSGRKNLVVSDSGVSRSRRRMEKGSGKYDYTTGLYLLLISLSVLVLWGRLCAILWTSTCLCFAPLRKTDDVRSEKDDQPGNMKKSPEIRGRENRKQVIMEGLFERNHHSV
ncbi:uncharacterized protein LOC131237094 [Magnolia sinica]|uniref:uncharacterized protein LOC131237094 n=1 Tax=Magnolia sinica TaxID=86752 RepID=UPI00265B4811|nr:uncharacterized protein LOC131237094 [Magnolia sinica]